MSPKLLLCITGLFIVSGIIAQDIDFSYIPYRKGDNWGYTTAAKEIIIQPKYAETSWFSEGLAAVKVGSKWGYINKEGKLVIPAKYTVAKPFRIGYIPGKVDGESTPVIFAGASLTTDGYEICINTKGVRMAQCPAIPENLTNESFSSFKKQKSYSLPDSEGLFDEIIDDYTIKDNPETFYIAIKQNRYGVFNSKFETIVPFIYDSITLIKKGESYLLVSENHLYGVLGTDGRTLIKPEGISIIITTTPLNGDFAIVKKEANAYITPLNNPESKSIAYAGIDYDEAGGFILTGLNGEKGYLFANNTTIEPKYRDIRMMQGGNYLYVITNTGKAGYINTSGKEYFEE
ncbi:MAG: WG repeat-containing protein [Ferruginibacter sp.]|nr:WG repeat-containing protein [Ferruginibacter sp.]